MNLLLFRKIEELPLHIIELDKAIAQLKGRSLSPDLSKKKMGN